MIGRQLGRSSSQPPKWTVTEPPSEMSTAATLYSVSRFMRITGWCSTGVGARWCRSPVDAAGIGDEGREHPVALGADEVVDVDDESHKVTPRVGLGRPC